MNINTERAIFAAGGAVLGGIVTYFATSKKLSRKFAAIAEEEIDSVKDSFNLFHGKGKYKDPEVQIAEVRQRMGYFEQLNDLAYAAQDREAEDVERAAVEAERRGIAANYQISSVANESHTSAVVETIEEDLEELFTTDQADEDIIETEEKLLRDPKVPYYISEQEFMEDEENFTKIHVEWYEEDDTLSDENDKLIPPAQSLNLLGPDFPAFFGRDEESPHIIHMRNERTRSDFEVALNPGSYTKLVLGYEATDEDRDRHRKQLKKMRDRE